MISSVSVTRIPPLIQRVAIAPTMVAGTPVQRLQATTRRSISPAAR